MKKVSVFFVNKIIFLENVIYLRQWKLFHNNVKRVIVITLEKNKGKTEYYTTFKSNGMLFLYPAKHVKKVMMQKEHKEPYVSFCELKQLAPVSEPFCLVLQMGEAQLYVGVESVENVGLGKQRYELPAYLRKGNEDIAYVEQLEDGQLAYVICHEIFFAMAMEACTQ